jgi:hypothetical protein
MEDKMMRRLFIAALLLAGAFSTGRVFAEDKPLKDALVGT